MAVIGPMHGMVRDRAVIVAPADWARMDFSRPAIFSAQCAIWSR